MTRDRRLEPGLLVALVAVVLLALWTGVLIVRVFLGLLTFAGCSHASEDVAKIKLRAVRIA